MREGERESKQASKQASERRRGEKERPESENESDSKSFTGSAGVQWCLDHVLAKGHHSCYTHDRLCTYSGTKCKEKTYEETQINCAHDRVVHMFDDHKIEARL